MQFSPLVAYGGRSPWRLYAAPVFPVVAPAAPLISQAETGRA